MRFLALLPYALSGFSVAISVMVLSVTANLDIPSCGDNNVLISVIALWKLRALRGDQPIQDGRLKEPIELPLRIANGRVCTAELLVDGRSNGSIGYTVMRPLKGAADMVNLD